MKINLKRDRLTGILLVAMMFVGMNVSAQRIRVQGHITNPQGKSVPNVNVLNPVNDERIEMSDEDGRYSVLVEKNGSLKFTCVGYEDKTVKVVLPIPSRILLAKHSECSIERCRHRTGRSYDYFQSEGQSDSGTYGHRNQR